MADASSPLNPSPTSPAPADAPPPPLPVPAPQTNLPGWKTSEAWINLLVIILGALPSSGLTNDSPTLTKIVGLIVAALSALNFTYQRSALKRAYYTAHTAYTTHLTQGAAPRGRLTQIAAAVSLCTLLVAGALCALPSCVEDCQIPQNAMSAKCIVSGSVVDCTGVSSLQTAVTVFEPIIAKLITSPEAQLPDGSINWSSIEQQIVNLALQYGACVVAEVWNDLVGNGAHVLAVRAPQLKKEFERIRARIAPGRTFIVGNGQKM